jgi:hypothetical protein
MHQILLTLHSFIRWLVLLSLLYAIFRAYKGYTYKLIFNKMDDAVRHWTATFSHIQLIIGITIYFKSPIVKLIGFGNEGSNFISEHLFFKAVHISMMIFAVIIITIGSAKAKRMEHDTQKFKTMLIWFSIALIIIFIAIPWPFSPLANRPYIRSF